MRTNHFLTIVFLISCTFSFAQLGVGITNPDASAQLDIVSNNKGLLIPRLALNSLTDGSTISSGNTESLMVYNTSTTTELEPGYYYWANNSWNRIAIQEEINTLAKDVISTNGSITGVAANAALVAMDLEVKVDNTTLEVDPTNGMQLKDNGIQTAKIAENAVDGTKIQVTNEAKGSVLVNNGTEWVSLPIGLIGQILTVNAAGAPEWATPASAKRIGEFVYAKSGRTIGDGYLAVSPGTITDGAITYPLWAAQYPEFVTGNDIVFPANVAGMFLRNLGGNATTEGAYQADATAMPKNRFNTNYSGSHNHTFTNATGYTETDGRKINGNGGDGWADPVNTTNSAGSHSHYISSGGDNETRPHNRAYQLYTIVDTY